MKIKRTSRIIAIIIIATAILGGVAIFAFWNHIPSDELEVDPLQLEEYQITSYMNEYAGYDFCTHISLFIHTDSDGNTYLIGKLDPELDTMLASLVYAYSIDPRNTKSITVDEVRYNLTEGIVEATAKDTKFSAFYYFLCWCDTPADLVWRSDGVTDDGVPHSTGDPVGQDIKNFDFITGREGSVYSQFKYPWE